MGVTACAVHSLPHRTIKTIFILIVVKVAGSKGVFPVVAALLLLVKVVVFYIAAHVAVFQVLQVLF